MINQHQNKVAVISGADRGIGKAISEKMAAANIETVLISNNLSGLEEVKLGIENFYQNEPFVISLDVRDSNSIKTAINNVVKKYGHIDYLINVAGVAYFGGIELCTEEQWDETLNVNVKGYFLLSKAVFPHMKKVKSGTIINMSSVWGVKGAATMIAYSTSKFAVEGFTKSLSEEARPHGIKVASIVLDKVDTEFREAMRDHVNFTNEQKMCMLTADDVADTVSWIIGTSSRALPSSIVLDAFLWK